MKWINTLLYWPFYFLYTTSSCKEEILKDLEANSIYGASILIRLAQAGANRYFRGLLYFRNRNIISKVLRVFYPKERLFILDIHSKIGGGLRLAHPYSTIINARSLGENCYINHLVTIGEKTGQKPTIGNNVQIHANATIIGGITIGNDVIIGAGAVVVKDVPNGCVVIGNPARIIKT